MIFYQKLNQKQLFTPEKNDFFALDSFKLEAADYKCLVLDLSIEAAYLNELFFWKRADEARPD